MNPVVVHVVRPYSSEQAYLSAEAWTIDAKGMLLIDTEALPSDTAVLFDVALLDGQKPIRAEGRVVGRVAPSAERPGGTKVRFKRFGTATKAFIERAVQANQNAGATERSQVELERPSSPGALPAAAAEPSGPRQRRPGPVAAPANRDELLARLRQRRHTG